MSRQELRHFVVGLCEEWPLVTLLEDITRLREIDRLKSECIATASHEGV